MQGAVLRGAARLCCSGELRTVISEGVPWIRPHRAFVQWENDPGSTASRWGPVDLSSEDRRLALLAGRHRTQRLPPSVLDPGGTASRCGLGGMVSENRRLALLAGQLRSLTPPQNQSTRHPIHPPVGGAPAELRSRAARGEAEMGGATTRGGEAEEREGKPGVPGGAAFFEGLCTATRPH
ncbi:unnamed protein product [Prorocentrum cordatum]|uniref:Uncharacterized protein n=1 Tax=Prorocentrum cordatum TaxID=2364126 RepID=A0ABN9SP88_9DINO|nr:unnamed protein product [Polarella glacialis]